MTARETPALWELASEDDHCALAAAMPTWDEALDDPGFVEWLATLPAVRVTWRAWALHQALNALADSMMDTLPEGWGDQS